MNNFIVADPNKCIGCRTCEIACALAHLPADALVTGRWTGILTHGCAWFRLLLLVFRFSVINAKTHPVLMFAPLKRL